MEPEKLVENICDIAKNAVPKIPRKWANVQVISVKIPESVALPVYNKTPEILSQLAKLSGYGEEKVVVTEEKKEATKAEDKASKKKGVKSPLLQALKKVENEGKKKSKNAPKEKKEEDKPKSEQQRSKRKSSDAADEVKKSSSPDKKRRSSAEGAKPAKEAKAQESQEKKDFMDSKKFKGSKKGYVFRAGIQGVGYYIDVKPVVDRAAMEALKRMGGGKKKEKKGRGGRRSY
jgi:ribosome biogenesis protein UTP30